MSRELKIRRLQSALLEWYELNGRKFPWREEGLSSYQLVIAETLLQRTKAETVAKFFDQFVIDFPDWESLDLAECSRIEEYLKPIGLYRQRSKRLKSLAKEMVIRKGQFPKKRADLESIPFLGQYIANSVELLLFNKPKPLIDVNMSRVIERVFGERELADIRYDPYLQNLALKVVKVPSPKHMNWAILDFAALVCKANRPLCTSCGLNRHCLHSQKKY